MESMSHHKRCLDFKKGDSMPMDQEFWKRRRTMTKTQTSIKISPEGLW